MPLELNNQIYNLKPQDISKVDKYFTETKKGKKTVKECILVFDKKEGFFSELNKKTIYKSGGSKPGVCTIEDPDKGEMTLRYYTSKVVDGLGNPTYKINGSTKFDFLNPEGKAFQIVINQGQKEMLFFMLMAGWVCTDASTYDGTKHFLVVKNEEKALEALMVDERIFAEVGHLILITMNDEEVLSIGQRLGIPNMSTSSPNMRRSILKDFYVKAKPELRTNNAKLIKAKYEEVHGIMSKVLIEDSSITEGEVRAVITKATDSGKLFCMPTNRTWYGNPKFDKSLPAKEQDKTERREIVKFEPGQDKVDVLIDFLTKNPDMWAFVKSLE